ncbi:MAG: hypothetical protein ACR2QJ_11270, partial [Geminicoccaceae bacterium]
MMIGKQTKNRTGPDGAQHHQTEDETNSSRPLAQSNRPDTAKETVRAALVPPAGRLHRLLLPGLP